MFHIHWGKCQCNQTVLEFTKWFLYYANMSQMMQMVNMALIALVLLVGFGVTEFALLFPRSRLSGWLVRDVILLPYWQMHMNLYQDKVLQVWSSIGWLLKYTFLITTFRNSDREKLNFWIFWSMFLYFVNLNNQAVTPRYTLKEYESKNVPYWLKCAF